jgi:hypothetical protein
MWVDEAESSLNALTIVADGVPGDRFFGQPLYENTLVRPWPGNDEYEFRDLSYSDRGLAVYHAWIPLYAIAAAFRVAGVTPEQASQGTPVRDTSAAALRYWTAVPRVPAVIFGAMSVVAAWALARRVAGEPAAVALALAVATADVFVAAGRQARYYSALVAASTLCGLAIWNARHRDRLLDHVLAGAAVGVVFHVHSVSAVALSGLYAGAIVIGPRQPRLWLRMAAAGSTGALLIIPWAAWSGLLDQTAVTPAARDYVDAQLLLGALPWNPPFWATLGAGLAWTAVASWRSPLGESWRRPFRGLGAGFAFAVAWLVLACFSFFAIMPAASAFRERLNLMVAVPLMLLVSLLAVAVGRVVRPRSLVLPAGVVLLVLAVWGQFPPRLPRPITSDDAGRFAMIRDWPLAAGGRIFATPNDHLVLTYYTNRPVQSIAAVRREWLDRFRGDLVILEGGRYRLDLTAQVIREAAARLRIPLADDDVTGRSQYAVMLATARDLEASGVDVEPLPRQPDALDLRLVDLLRDATRRAVRDSLRGTPLSRDTTLANWQDFRDAFFYWFSNPASRTGEGLNYRACRARARASVLPGGLVVLDCRQARELPLVSHLSRSTR